jgi:hypothetical protein
MVAVPPVEMAELVALPAILISLCNAGRSYRRNDNETGLVDRAAADTCLMETAHWPVCPYAEGATRPVDAPVIQLHDASARSHEIIRRRWNRELGMSRTDHEKKKSKALHGIISNAQALHQEELQILFKTATGYADLWRCGLSIRQEMHPVAISAVPTVRIEREKLPIEFSWP